jgi:phosphate-selective porin OprO/OprP
MHRSTRTAVDVVAYGICALLTCTASIASSQTLAPQPVGRIRWQADELGLESEASQSQGPTPVAGTGQGVAAPPAKVPSIYDKIWRFATWYDNESNPAVEKVLFSGRFQYEYAALDADQGSHSEWNVRRMRFGPKVTFLQKFTLHTEVEVNPQEADPFYMRLTDAYVQWSQSERFNLTVGKHGVLFTMDGSTSSKELLAIDRSNLSNNIWFPQEYMPGVGVSGKQAPWIYRGGIYSAGAMNKEFGEFTGSFFTLAVVGYDFARSLGVKKALLAGNYVYQDPDPENTFTRQLQNVSSLNFDLETDRWGVRADVSGASGYLGQSDLWALMAMPFFNVGSKLQLVGRYTFIESESPNGVRLATYESSVVSGRGDRYNELYAGANYYFYGHKLKLQTGVQFADMDDSASDGGAYSGVAWTTGVRVGW